MSGSGEDFHGGEVFCSGYLRKQEISARLGLAG